MISIIVPIYGVEAYLSRCLDSLQAQTLADWEAILVDDGSPDACGAICDAYAAADARFRVIHQANGGLSAARNAGLSAAKGEWILFLDSDDWIHPRTLELLLSAALEQGTDMAMCDFAPVSRWREPAKLDCPAVSVMEGRKALLSIFRQDRVRFVVSWGKLWKRDRLVGLRFPEGRNHEDEATTYRLFYPLDRLALVEAPLWCYYQNPTGIMHTAYSVKRLDALTAFEEAVDFFAQEKDEECLQAALKTYWQCAIDQRQLMRENGVELATRQGVTKRVEDFCSARNLPLSATAALLLREEAPSRRQLRAATATDLVRERGFFGCATYYWKKLLRK